MQCHSLGGKTIVKIRRRQGMYAYEFFVIVVDKYHYRDDSPFFVLTRFSLTSSLQLLYPFHYSFSYTPSITVPAAAAMEW